MPFRGSLLHPDHLASPSVFTTLSKVAFWAHFRGRVFSSSGGKTGSAQPAAPPARSALPGVFSLRSHHPCHGVSRLEPASWPSMDAGHMHSPWVASGPQGDLDSH